MTLFWLEKFGRPGFAQILRAVLAAAALALAGCASVEPPPASEAAVEPKPVATAAPVSPERARLVEAFGGEYVAPATKRYLDDVLIRLANASVSPTDALSRHAAQFADRQRLRAALRRHFHHPRSTGFGR